MASTREIGATLSQLEELALDPLTLDNDATLEKLRRLQYRLHVAGETTEGELGDALSCARDATAVLVTTLEEDGVESASLPLHEWRGALFRVRLARMRLEQPVPETPIDPVLAPPRRRLLAALALVIAGAAAFATGAGTGEWPLWAAGMLAVCGSFLTYNP